MCRRHCIEARRHRSGSAKPFIITAIIIFVLLAVLVVKVVVGTAMAFAAQDSAFQALASFVQPFIVPENLTDDLIGDPYINGRVLIADGETGEVSHFFYNNLPEDIRSTTSIEIGTIVLFRRIDVEAGQYEDEQTGQISGSGYQVLYDIEVIDVAEKRIVSHHLLQGEMPSASTQWEGDVYGRAPDWELLDYVKAMPRR